MLYLVADQSPTVFKYVFLIEFLIMLALTWEFSRAVFLSGLLHY